MFFLQTKSKIKILISLSLGLAFAILIILILAVIIPTQNIFAKTTDIICVHEGEVIQDAIDSADPFDEIRIQKGTYTENLTIDESLTLSGYWQDECTVWDYTNDVHLHADNKRGITISNTETISVSILNINITGGNATGLGGADPQLMIQIPSFQDWLLTKGITYTEGINPDPAESWRTVLETALEKNALPGGEQVFQETSDLYETLLSQGPWGTPEFAARLETLENTPDQILAVDNGEVDCGGGLYANNTYLQLRGVSIFGSVASTNDEGYGGGLCAVNLPPEGIIIGGYPYEDSQFRENIASTSGGGYGGAIYINGQNQASVNILGEEYGSFIIDQNRASLNDCGGGGGLAIIDAAEVEIDGVIFTWNLAGSQKEYESACSGTSYGGGLLLKNSPNANISDVTAVNNQADEGGFSGMGGGAAFIGSDNLNIGDDSYFARNVAHSNLGIYGPFGSAGGLAILQSSGITVSDSSFEYNAAGVYGFGMGGGLAAFESEDILIEDNKFQDNTATFYVNGNPFGGGAIIIKSNDITVQENEFLRNIVSQFAAPDFVGLGPNGGGLCIDGSEEAIVKNNTFQENTGVLSGEGQGAGMVVGASSFVEISNNTFDKNVSTRVDAIGLAPSAGNGAGVLIDTGDNILVKHNLFTNNAGSTSETGYPGSVIFVHGSSPGSEGLNASDITIEGNRILDSGQNLIPDQTVEASGILVMLTKSITVTNNVLANTDGYGMAFVYYLDPETFDETNAWIMNNTIVNFQDTALIFNGNFSTELLTITNNIIYTNTTGIQTDTKDEFVVDHNLFFGNQIDIDDVDGEITNNNPVYGNPNFVDTSTHDYHLELTSAARDAGIGYPFAPPVDIEGRQRPYGLAVDIGAHEWIGTFLPWIFKMFIP